MRLFGIQIGRAKRSNAQTGEVPWLQGNRDEIVTAEDAMKVAAVFACVRVIAETVATLPCILYRRLPGGGKERATDHPLYSVLHDSPNLLQDSVQFFEMLTGHLALRGNAFAHIDFTRKGVVLTPLHPSKVTVKTADEGRYKYYEYWNGTRTLQIKPQNMVHVFGLSADGLKGMSPIDLAMRTVRLAAKQEQYADVMFTNRASPGGVLKHPGKLSKEAAERLKSDFDKKYAGTDKTGSTMLIEEGMEWQQIGLTNEQAQFIQGRKFSRSEIAMWFRMPPHKIGDLEKATFSNIEHQALEFVTDTIRPWLVRWERALLKALFTEEERKEYAIEFLVDAIVRGDIQTRFSAYATARQWGWLNVDEIREKENMNPLPDDKGKTYLEPMNMNEAGKKPEETLQKDAKTPEKGTETDENDAETDKKEDNNLTKNSFKPVIRAVLSRNFRRKKKILETKTWTDELREKEKQQFFTEIEPILSGLRAENQAEKWFEMSERVDLTEKDKTLIEQLEDLVDVLLGTIDNEV